VHLVPSVALVPSAPLTQAAPKLWLLSHTLPQAPQLMTVTVGPQLTVKFGPPESSAAGAASGGPGFSWSKPQMSAHPGAASSKAAATQRRTPRVRAVGETRNIADCTAYRAGTPLPSCLIADELRHGAATDARRPLSSRTASLRHRRPRGLAPPPPPCARAILRAMSASAAHAHTLVVDNPFTGEPACEVPLADSRAAGTVLDAAQKAAKAWRNSPLSERIALCERAVVALESKAESIAADITRMMGKPLSQARGEVKTTAVRARHMMSIAEAALADVVLPLDGFERRIVREPLGVVLDLPAWNYPLLTAVNCVVPAVLAGNAVVVKHSPRSPLCGEHFARAFAEAGAPAKLVQSLNCDHAHSERLVGDERVDQVVFTGSIFGGHRMVEAAAKRFLHPTLELGGNDPAYAAADCDLAKTVENVVDGACYNAGQSCCAVERVYVHKSVYGRFLELAEPLVRAYVMGDPMSPETSLGPIAQRPHVAELESFVADARAKGARLIAGGNATSVDGRGRFFEATLIADGDQSMDLFARESFGPIVAVMPVGSDEEALAKMNDSRLGLTASVWTTDRDRAARFAKSLECGTVFMNRCDYLDPALPWSGWKDSGRGASLSAFGFEGLTRPKSIHFRLA
jgi:acyl-CoA reductase-like NAD-dependent aldehyde dehydrogenase